jgi:hypothetical protein
MEISVNVRSNAASSLQQGRMTGPDVKELINAAHDLGLNLQPKHPGLDAPGLAGQFMVHVDGPEEGWCPTLIERQAG